MIRRLLLAWLAASTTLAAALAVGGWRRQRNARQNTPGFTSRHRNATRDEVRAAAIQTVCRSIGRQGMHG